MGTFNCVYETPCGWCSKWDKECDKKMHTSAYRRKHPQPLNMNGGALANKMCQSESDDEWS